MPNDQAVELGQGFDEKEITCWCGAKGKPSELFDDSGLPLTCSGMGMLECECGGDHLCVCHHHGEVVCYGCEDCEGDEDDEWAGAGWP